MYLVMVKLALCILGNCSCFFVVRLFFSKSIFSKNSFRKTIRVSNSMDPDQAQHAGIPSDISNSFDPDQAGRSVGANLGPSCLQRLSAEDKICHQQAKG